MDIKQRRWLYSLFILLFLIISPLVIAYALGYRLDTTGWKVTKVGALYIKSYPAGAKIIVNDKVTKRKTPSQVINIPVGANTFSVEKDGYQPWTKTMNVVAGDTTFVQDILIFKQDFKKQVLGNGGSQLIPSTNDDAYIYINKQQELVVINTTNRSANVVGKLPATAQLRQWTADERAVLYTVGSTWFTLTLADDQSRQISPKPAKPITKALIADNVNDILFTSSQILYRWNASSQSLTVISTKVKDFALGDGQLAFLTDTGLSLSDLNDTTRTVTPMDSTDDLQLARVSRDLQVLQHGDQYWIWRDGKVEQRINATSFDWKKNSLLFSNDYELTIYDVTNHTTNVTDRTSIKTLHVSWHPSANYFARVQNSILDLVEIDSRGDKRHVIPIATINPTDTYIFDPKGEYIFILTPEETYSLQLQ